MATQYKTDVLSNEAWDLLDALNIGNEDPISVWMGIHGVIVSVESGIRLYCDDMKTLANNPLFRWLDTGAGVTTLGLTHEAVKQGLCIKENEVKGKMGYIETIQEFYYFNEGLCCEENEVKHEKV
jgi:hypothetical protein